MMKCNRMVMGMALVLLLAAGCVSEAPVDENKFGHMTMKRPDKVAYEQIDTKGLTLEPIGNMVMASGTPGFVYVQLSNHSIRDVQIAEWYMIDQYNFAVYYRRLPADRPADPKTPYQCYSVRIPAKPRPVHSELRLKPHNRAQMLIELPFIGDLAPGEKAEFEVYVATSLMTFKIQTAPFTVTAQ